MSLARAWFMAALFLVAGIAGILTLYVGMSDCAYTAEPPACTNDAEVVAAVTGFSAYGLLLIGLIFLVRAIVLELRGRPNPPQQRS